MNAASGGGFGNFIAHNIFGRSNQPTGVNPAGGAGGSVVDPSKPPPGYQTGNTQLNPQNNNSQIQNGNTGAADLKPGDPNNNADPNKGAQGSQLDNFKDIFKLPTDDKGQPLGNTDPLAQPIMQFDAAKLKEAASKMNFAQGIDAELLQKAMSGQDPQAFMQVLNTVAQTGFTSAISVTSKMAETAIATNNQRFEQALPDRIRTTQINQAQPKHPALAHPAAAPMVSALKMQIAQTNPHLPPDRVAEMAENYVIAMATDINTVNTQTETKTKNKNSSEPDWGALLGVQ